jgi:hypothetical protein
MGTGMPAACSTHPRLVMPPPPRRLALSFSRLRPRNGTHAPAHPSARLRYLPPPPPPRCQERAVALVLRLPARVLPPAVTHGVLCGPGGHDHCLPVGGGAGVRGRGHQSHGGRRQRQQQRAPQLGRRQQLHHVGRQELHRHAVVRFGHGPPRREPHLHAGLLLPAQRQLGAAAVPGVPGRRVRAAGLPLRATIEQVGAEGGGGGQHAPCMSQACTDRPALAESRP